MAINQEKLSKVIKLEEALRDNKEAYVLLKELEEISDKVDAIPQTDLTEINEKLDNLKDEEIVVELNIV